MRSGLVLMLALTACGSRPESTCPNDLPSSCVSAPSWTSQVSPIFTKACAPCHSPTGSQPSPSLVTWADVSARRANVLSAVYGCKMPSPDAGVDLTTEERGLVLRWLVCGAPEN